MAQTKKENTGYFYLWAFAVAIAIGGGQALWHQIDSAQTLATIAAIKGKIGEESFDRLVTAISPMTYGGYCVEGQVADPTLTAAVKAYNARNETKIDALLAAVKAKGGMTHDEKAAFNAYAAAQLLEDIRS